MAKAAHAAPRLVVADAAARALGRGHPWIYAEKVTSAPRGARAGDVVEVADATGRVLGRGYFDPASPIRARVLTTDGDAVDARFVVRRLDAAFGVRRALFRDEETTAYRLVNGEGDRLPGLVIDRYADAAVVRTDGEGAASFYDAHRARIVERLLALGVRSVASRLPRGEDGGAKITEWGGAPVPTSIAVREHGMTMEVDLSHGQKTGAFLDQRENRRRVRELARGRRVLNLFSYAGGFSLAAALGGATHVTSVDIARGGHATAQRSFRLSGADPAAHAFVTSDAFQFLESARARGERWDLVVSDPPSFAPSEKAKARGMAAYRKLHAACASVVVDGGLFCAASCSSHVTSDDFAATLDLAAVGRPLRMLASYGQPEDHPSLPAWLEGRYLKFVVLAVA